MIQKAWKRYLGEVFELYGLYGLGRSLYRMYGLYGGHIGVHIPLNSTVQTVQAVQNVQMYGSCTFWFGSVSTIRRARFGVRFVRFVRLRNPFLNLASRVYRHTVKDKTYSSLRLPYFALLNSPPTPLFDLRSSPIHHQKFFNSS